MRITIANLPQRLELRGREDGPSALRNETLVPLRTLDEALVYLRRHCTRQGAVSQLRDLAMAGLYGAAPATDADVLAEVARRIAAGRLLVVALPGSAARAASSGGDAVVPVAGASAPRRPPTMPPSGTLRPPSRAPVPAPVADEADDFADVAQDAQAATLEQGAETGVPFCEVCAQASARKQTSTETTS